ncbi:MAG: ATP-dependent Clp protease ATP-binding subunit ClpC, partial [Acidimicrobiaceae bacterium]|nr:ATP-dependent Clp protease ATP-binding subunit ClpC [Acidimicrobiaceae bacterium]
MGTRGYPCLVMFERFAEEARRATALASQEARELRHDFIGTEHLLLGLLATGEGTAYSVLTELEVTLDDARRKVSERVHAYGTESVESPPFTPLAKKSLERALREALQFDARVIGTEHLLL